MRASPFRTLQWAFLSLLILGLMALALGGFLTPITRVLMTPVLGAQTYLATRFQALRTMLNAPQDVVELRRQNADLQNQIAELEAEIIDLEQQLTQTRVLSALVDFARVHPENSYMGASVIGRDPNPLMSYVIINRGSDSGLRRGMPVVTHQGLVGRIVAVTAGAARVQIITDPASSVNVRLDPSGAQAVLNGNVKGEIELNMISKEATVQAGDLVLTSGLGGNYPSNILIGQVAAVRSRETDLFQTGSVQPLVDFTRLEIVLVITNFRPVDITPLVPATNP